MTEEAVSRLFPEGAPPEVERAVREAKPPLHCGFCGVRCLLEVLWGKQRERAVA